MEVVRVRLVSSEGKGCEDAPIKILEKLKKIKFKENGKGIDFEKLNLEEIHVDLNNLDEGHHLIYENGKEIFERNFKCFFVGGDHSIDYSLGRAFFKVQDNPLMIVFDGEFDGKEGGCFGWLRKLIDNGVEGSSILIVGARGISIEDLKYLKENNVVVIGMDVIREDIEGVCDLIMERARKSGGFYLSTDIKVVDPAFAPAVNKNFVGGLSSRDLIYIIKRLVLLGNFRGASLVGINPSRDINEMTVELGARLLGEMI